MTCKSCGGVNFETYEAEGNKVCIGCGTVQEENTIVSELAFADNAFGGHSLVGTMVGFGQSGAKLRTGLGSFTNSSNNELTITKANELARKFGTALYLADHYVDKAMNFFKLLLIHNFSRGRKSEVTIAVCLYAACRVNQTTHMLIDFSDLAEASVFTLGSAFVKLVGLLNLKSEVALVDPSLYISRFAACLGFGDKQHKVAETAIRLVTRMKRDWMTTGRRPAGICGASLLIASRIHHFNRNINQIVKIVRMSSDTVKKRLEEFASTETGKMTVDDFHNINLEAFEDPPAYKRARKAESLAEKALLIKKKEELIEANLSNFNGKISNEVIEIEKDDGNLNKSIKISNIEVEKEIEKGVNSVDEQSHQKTSSEMSLDETEEEEINLKEEISNYITEPKASIVKIKTDYEKWEENEEEDDDGNLDELDDDVELQNMFLNQNEVERKTEVWTGENADYLAAQKAKEERLREEERNGIIKKKIKRGPKKKLYADSDNLAEATKQVLKQIPQTRKINFDSLTKCLDEPIDYELFVKKK